VKRSLKSHNIEYYLNAKPKITTTIFIALFAVVIAFTLEMSTGDVGHSQIMPANNSGDVFENNTIPSEIAKENMTSSQSAVNHTQNSDATSILSNSSLIKTTTNTMNSTQNATNTPSPIPQVKITSNTKGQIVSEGILSIAGISSDNPASTCDVYVILNGIKPYQRVTPTEQSGSGNSTKDYSLWKYTFLPTYGLITEGDNKMTAKITCLNGSANSTKFNSLNVTGVSTNSTNSTNSNALLTRTPVPSQGGENTTTNNLEPVLNGTTAVMSTYSPHESVQQTPASGGITPQSLQTNYNGTTPSLSQPDEIHTQNSSTIQQEEHIPENSISILEADKDPSTDQLNSVDKEISSQTKKAVDEFIARVQGTVEERLEEAIKLRTPFQLVTPIPFDSEDN
jgi:hypothetical protein